MLLTPTDVHLLKELLEVLGEAFEEPHTYGGAVPADEYLRDLLGKPNFLAVVAVKDATVVGGLTAYILDKPEQERREIYIYDLAVNEPYRRQGIARGLIEELKQVARERRAYVIYVQADYGDDPAIALYTSLGTREEVLHFDIEP